MNAVTGTAKPLCKVCYEKHEPERTHTAETRKHEICYLCGIHTFSGIYEIATQDKSKVKHQFYQLDPGQKWHICKISGTGPYSVSVMYCGKMISKMFATRANLYRSPDECKSCRKALEASK